MQKKTDSGLILLFIGLAIVFYLSYFLNSEENQLVSLIKLSPGVLIATAGLILDMLKGKNKETDETTS